MNRGRQHLSLAVCDVPLLDVDRGPHAFFSFSVCSSSNCGLAYTAAASTCTWQRREKYGCLVVRVERHDGVLQQQAGNCHLVLYFKGTFCGEWTVLCIHVRCLLTRTTLQFVMLRWRQRQFIVYTYIYTSEAFLLPNKSGLARFVKFSLSFFSSLPRLCEIISHALQSEDRSTARFALS